MNRIIGRLSATLAIGFLLCGCRFNPDYSKPADRRAVAEDVVETIGERRDRAPHDNPRAEEIDAQYIEAYAAADTPLARLIALSKLVDQFADGHASVQPPPDLLRSLHAPSATIAELDGRLWIEFSGREVREGIPSEGRRGRYCCELLEIDGYPPKGVAAVHNLLCGERGSSTTLLCRMLRSNMIRTISLARDGAIWDVDRARTGGATLPDGTRIVASHPRFEHDMYAAVICETPRIGLVRLPWMSSPGRPDEDPDFDCIALHKPCDDLSTMLRLIESLADCDWVIFDIQGSSGGTCAHAGAIAAAIMPRSIDPLPFEHLDCPMILKLLDKRPWGWTRAPVFRPETRFAAMIDGQSVSASEHIAGVLRAVPSTVIVGSRSAGSEYSVARVKYPDGTVVRYGANPGVWSGLDIVEGRGIPPGIEVRYDEDIMRTKGIKACIRDHRNRSLEAALAEIRRVSGQ